MVKGFSHITCAPASRAALACAKWWPGGLPTTTMSGLRGDDLVPVVGRLLEPEVVLDPRQQRGVASVDDGELDLTRVTPPDEIGQMRADGPGTCADDAQT